MTNDQARKSNLFELTQSALTGLLASEAGENGQWYGEKYKDSEGNPSPFSEKWDGQQRVKNTIVMTRPQHLAQEAVAIAKATLEELEKHDITNNPA